MAKQKLCGARARAPALSAPENKDRSVELKGKNTIILSSRIFLSEFFETALRAAADAAENALLDLL